MTAELRQPANNAITWFRKNRGISYLACSFPDMTMRKVPVDAIFCFVAGVLLLSYTVSRGYTLSFTHDESLTYTRIMHDSFMQVVSNNTSYLSANNHILNTLLMKLSESIFGSEEVALRFFTLLAHLVFLIYSYRLLKNIPQKIIVMCGFIVVNVNPYMLDFFSLARGYGMAIALMTVSVYYMSAYMRNTRPKELALSFAAAGFAVLANFGLLYYMLSLVAVYELYLVYMNKGILFAPAQFMRKNITVLITLTVTAIICYEPVRKLVVFHELYFGGNTGFWHDTVVTLVTTFLYGKPYGALVSVPVLAGVGVVFFGALAVFGYAVFKRVSPAHPLAFACISMLLLVLIILLSVVLHLFSMAGLLQERYALFIVPLFALAATGLMSAVALKYRLIGRVGMCVLALLFVVHFAFSMNFQYTLNWQYDAATKAMLGRLEHEPRAANRQTKLGITWLFEPTINFYRMTHNLHWLKKVTRGGTTGNYDYYYVDTIGIAPLKDHRILEAYPVAGTVLMK
jgi:hypothetical protein